VTDAREFSFPCFVKLRGLPALGNQLGNSLPVFRSFGDRLAEGSGVGGYAAPALAYHSRQLTALNHCPGQIVEPAALAMGCHIKETAGLICSVRDWMTVAASSGIAKSGKRRPPVGDTSNGNAMSTTLFPRVPSSSPS
jgi:hypothetical protein